MAKQQRGSARASRRPTPPTASGGRPGTPSGSRPGSGWQPNRVSASGSSRRAGPNRTLLATVAAVVVGLTIVAFVAVQQLGKPSASSTGQLVTPASKTPASVPVDGRTMGRADAPATLDLYGDFRCSACYYFTEAGTEDKLVANEVAVGKARIVWHDFVIIDRDGTTASRDAANAAWCAADQGKFWPMHDWLYANQSQTEAPSAFTIGRLLAIGERAGLDMAAFTPCVQGGTHNGAIAAEQTSTPADVTGTPTVIVNGKVVGTNGRIPTYDEIKAAIDAVAGGPSGAPGSSSGAPASPSGSPAASPSG